MCRKSRKTVDTTETMKKFGPVEIHYGKVQQKVNLKYDSWHREILSRFGSLLGEKMLDKRLQAGGSSMRANNATPLGLPNSHELKELIKVSGGGKGMDDEKSLLWTFWKQQPDEEEKRWLG